MIWLINIVECSCRMTGKFLILPLIECFPKSHEMLYSKLITVKDFFFKIKIIILIS